VALQVSQAEAEKRFASVLGTNRVPVGQAASEKEEGMSKSPIDIIEEYIQMLAAGHVKEGLREASKEEVEFAIALLQAIAADIGATE